MLMFRKSDTGKGFPQSSAGYRLALPSTSVQDYADKRQLSERLVSLRSWPCCWLCIGSYIEYHMHTSVPMSCPAGLDKWT